jgi:Zinc finger, C2H2 type
MYHKPKKFSRCEFCGKNFKNITALAAHWLQIHDHTNDHYKDRIMTCHFCGKRFLGRSHMIVHMQWHRQRPRKCRICQLDFPDPNAVVDHKVAAHGFKCFPCKKCEKKFVTNSELRKHDRYQHLPKSPYICHYCGQKIRSRQSMIKHLEAHVNKTGVRCSVCYARCRDQGTLRTHMEVFHNVAHQKDECNICGVFVKNILVHKLKFHKSCQFCDKKFSKKNSIALHLFHTHDHIADHVKDRLMICHFCGKKFLSRSYLIKHMENHRRKPTKCKFCQLKFPDYNAVVDHQVIAHDRQCFACATCGKKFIIASKLKRHEATHLAEHAPYTCAICGKKFRHRETIEYHLRWSHMSKAVQCKVCKVKCRDEESVKVHMENYHNKMFAKFYPVEEPEKVRIRSSSSIISSSVNVRLLYIHFVICLVLS